MKKLTFLIKVAIAGLTFSTLSGCASTSDRNEDRTENPIFQALVSDALSACPDSENCPPEPIQSRTTFTIYDDGISEYTCSGTKCYCFRPVFNGSDCNTMRDVHCPNSDLTPDPNDPSVETCRCEMGC